MLIDTHAHLNFSAFDKDRNEVIRRCLEENIWTINIGTNYETSKKGVEISNKYKNGVFATVALHPINLETGLIKRKIDEFEGKHFEEEFDFKKYKNLALGKNLDFRSAQNKVSHLDGVRIDFSDWWFNARPSNTENLLRVVVEAKTKKKMEEKLKEIRKIINKT